MSKSMSLNALCTDGPSTCWGSGDLSHQCWLKSNWHSLKGLLLDAVGPQGYDLLAGGFCSYIIQRAQGYGSASARGPRAG